jgi:hypothetical protein
VAACDNHEAEVLDSNRKRLALEEKARENPGK